ncbi:MAG: DNA polymerase III subunit beta, partial [Leptolyngbyaceae bacterium]|nr:DNA polymerase III subunit beta [Leptolyngbyaceae bacterium]
MPSRPTHPVLANILLIADDNTQRVSLTSFDLSLGIRTSFDAQVEVGGRLTLPAKLLTDIVARLPDGEMTLDAEIREDAAEGILATLVSASGRYQVRGMGAEEFPELPVVEDGGVAHFSVEALLEGLQGSLIATSSDETKQVLTGVHLTVQKDSLEFAATDGHRLAVVQTINPDSAESAAQGSTNPSEAGFDVTIPAKALRELERMIGNRAGSTVALHFDPGQVVFELADQRITSRLLEGQYPNYRQLIPRQFSQQVTVERRLFLGALERIAVLADQKNNVVKVSLDSVGQGLT